MTAITKKFLPLLSLLPLSLPTAATGLPADTVGAYTEQWRPQYHFTPLGRWIGDPCGCVYADGKYHAYSWGAAESDDLIHWREINHNAINGTPRGIAQFTGSVVVDRANTAGFGNNAYVAAFTSFDEQSKKQSQSIAFSHDGGATYQYYDLNPVVDIWSTEFRDPTVIWDEARNRWVMLVAKALEKKVAFYASPDLKHWEWLSDFGPCGDSEKSWECPDMFRLPVDGTGESKWVLLVSVNWAREQYFTGNFDGKGFIADNPAGEPLYVDAGLDYYASRTFQDFDGTQSDVHSIGWVSTWDYAQHVPTTYGKGVWSLPRKLSLTSTPEGLRLVQKPADALRSLRGKPVTLSRKIKPGTTALEAVGAMGNQYELEADFSTDTPNTFGLNLCTGSGRKVTLSYDVASQTLLLDRTNATVTDIPKFSRIAYAKVSPVDGTLHLDIFVDNSVIEVYTGDGRCVMTALAFPGEADNGVELFAMRPGTRVALTAYPLRSIWNKNEAERRN